MGDTDVAIGESELNLIGEYVQSHLTGWMEQLGVRAPQDPVTNTQLLERVVRVEEELKAGREVMVARFEASDRRFESIDLRIGDLIKTVDDRFKAVDTRFNTLTRTMDDRFRSAAKASDDRFADLIKTLDDRFAGVKENIGTVKWFIVTGILVLGTAISLFAVFQ